MDILLSKVTQQAMNYAIRSGITITSGYAIRQCSRLLKTVKGNEREELATLQLRLEGKIRIISPAIDMIELIAARGNTSLESAVTLTKSLRWDIQSLGVRLANAVGEEELARRGSSRAKSRAQNELELKLIISDIKRLLDRIEDAVPLINLAITTSGVSLSTTLPTAVSPSRLLQASTFLTAGDTQYSMAAPRSQQVGPVFTLSMYMLFSGHAYRPHDEEGIRETTWKEVMHKTRLKLLRVPLDRVYDYPSPDGGPSRNRDGVQVNGDENGHRSTHIPSEGKAHEFAYQLLIVEDLDDDRVHTFDDDEVQPGPYEDVPLAGIREIVPIHEISKIFYADTGKILNIGVDGETNNPILLLKRDVNAVPPRRMMEQHTAEPDWYQEESPTNEHVPETPLEYDEQSELDEQIRLESSFAVPEEPAEKQGQPQHHPWRLPPNLDPEWLAFEVYTEEPSSESDIDDSEVEFGTSVTNTPSRPQQGRLYSLDPSLTSGISQLNLRTPSPTSTPPPPNTQLIPSPQKSMNQLPQYTPKVSALPAIRTSLSLLEMLIRLTALQQFQQSSHLAIPDELLTFFLSESSTVGAGGDADLRRRVRREARQRVGFDPYDESPIKRRGEEYLEHAHDHDRDRESVGYRNYDHDHYDPYSGHEDYDADTGFDYAGYPHGPQSRYSRSRSGTPSRSAAYPPPPSSPLGAPLSPQSPGVPSADVPLPSREGRAQPRASLSSPSPLLRRATTMPLAGR
ncbi:Ran-binding-domain-containing protein [Glonium stellatum]|uniref:Ran-binding-domain-containing protein n=1 Tax=Glonium stellatum TaxID=574774 RepID=A0A8E2JNI8_9PEZI|nr:Ran-binding-domain-containing protein [Glonium stellatum]